MISLWVRGGFPESWLARSDRASLRWREQFIRTFLERDVPMFAPRLSAEALRRLWTMLAHAQGGLLNVADLARSLALDVRTAGRYLDVLVGMLLVRRLPPWHANVGKRLVRSPKVYVRDSGLGHALLGLADEAAVLGHPVSGASWEGFVIEQVAAACPPGRLVPLLLDGGRRRGGPGVGLARRPPVGPRNQALHRAEARPWLSPRLRGPGPGPPLPGAPGPRQLAAGRRAGGHRGGGAVRAPRGFGLGRRARLRAPLIRSGPATLRPLSAP
ncbi:MAG: DUF4143 domain-containing protein [Candidatus Sericytochromatia bacterium]|nr:DUF4143 domain-containing protein [Candidatus Sericytochromatia bacterium]